MTTALITGASAGLGAEFAAQLAARGHDLVLVARRAETLAEIAAPLREQYRVHVEVLPADLAEREQLARVENRILRPTGSGPIDLLVNNAGYGPAAEFLDNDVAAEEAMHTLMTTAVLVTSHAAARTMRARGRGAIINVASIAGFLPGGTYSADKSWVLTFTQALAIELQGTGVTATALAPGYVHTDFHEVAGWETAGSPDFAWLDAPRVVREALNAARRGAPVCVPSKRYQAVAAALDALPRPILYTVVARARRMGLLSEAGTAASTDPTPGTSPGAAG